MAGENDAKKLEGRFCSRCGQFVSDVNSPCPSCEAPVSMNTDQELSVSVHLSVLICDSCGHIMSIGSPSCPKCGEPTSEDEPMDPARGPINRAKLKALGDLLPRIKAASEVSASDDEPKIVMTDDQFLAFMNRNELMSETLISDLKGVLDRVDISSGSAIRSTATRRAMEDLLAGTNHIRSLYDDTAELQVPEQFSRLHLFLLSIYQSLLDLRLACANAIMALTLEDGPVAQQSIQASLDRLSFVSQMMVVELEKVDPEAVVFDQLNRRLTAFVGHTRQYDHEGQPDLAAALSAELGEGDSINALGQRGAAYFRRMMPVDPSTLPPEYAVTLYALAAETAALPDPLTVRRRASVLLSLYNDAYQRDPAPVNASTIQAEGDTERAIGHMLSLGDRLRSPRQNELPIDAARQELANVYVTLTEWIYRPLLNMPLVAKYVLSGRSTPYADIAHMDFGSKVNELSQTFDPRYAPALLGVSTIARNAGAHGDVDTSGEKITLTKRDRKGRTGTEEVSDEEFIKRLEDLFLTCQAISLANALFRIQHHQALPVPDPGFQRRVSIAHARTIVGRFGLVRAIVDVNDPNHVRVEAVEDENRAGREPRAHLVAAFTLATLFPNSTNLSLLVRRNEVEKCRITVPTAEVVSHLRLPEHVATYSILRLAYLSKIEGADTEEPARIIRELISPEANLLRRDLARLEQLREQLPSQREDYSRGLRQMSDVVQMLSTWLSELSPPSPADGPRRGLLAALDALAKGLIYQQKQVEAGKWQTLNSPNRHLDRGKRIIERWG